MKQRSLLIVNDCFKNENNAVVGVFLQRLITASYQSEAFPAFTTIQGGSLIIENWRDYFTDLKDDELQVQEVRIGGIYSFTSYDVTESNIGIRNVFGDYIGQKTVGLIISDGSLTTKALLEWTIVSP